MRVTDVRACILEGNFDWVLVRVDTDAGVSGFGECFSAWNSSVVKQLVLSMKQHLAGENPMDVDRLGRKMGLSMAGGLKVNAISGVEMALWDVAGKALGTPVYNLLGGRYRESIRVYADCHAGHSITSLRDYDLERRESYTPEGYAENARRVRRMGYEMLKFDLYPNISMLVPPRQPYSGHLSNAQVGFLASLVGAAREALGEDVDLAVDFGGYSVPDAIRLANALEPYRLAWVEDVVPWNAENVDALAQVTASVKTPTLTGELLHTARGFRELVVKQAVRVVAPDMGTVGGLLESRRVADLADLYHIPLAPHNIASPIGTFAACQVCASIPNLIALEFHAMAVPWWESLAKGVEKPIIRDGCIRLTEKPGIGVELDEKEAEKHLKTGETLF